MDYLSHCIKRSRRKLEGRATAGMLIILVVFSLLGWIYLSQASHVATTGRRVQELERNKAHLKQGNLELAVEIAELESVTRLATRAKELGFDVLLVEEAEFLFVADLPPSYGDPSDDGSATARWWSNVAGQFAAWAQVDAR